MLQLPSPGHYVRWCACTQHDCCANSLVAVRRKKKKIDKHGRQSSSSSSSSQAKPHCLRRFLIINFRAGGHSYGFEGVSCTETRRKSDCHGCSSRKSDTKIPSRRPTPTTCASKNEKRKKKRSRCTNIDLTRVKYCLIPIIAAVRLCKVIKWRGRS